MSPKVNKPRSRKQHKIENMKPPKKPKVGETGLSEKELLKVQEALVPEGPDDELVVETWQPLTKPSPGTTTVWNPGGVVVGPTGTTSGTSANTPTWSVGSNQLDVHVEGIDELKVELKQVLAEYAVLDDRLTRIEKSLSLIIKFIENQASGVVRRSKLGSKP